MMNRYIGRWIDRQGNGKDKGRWVVSQRAKWGKKGTWIDSCIGKCGRRYQMETQLDREICKRRQANRWLTTEMKKSRLDVQMDRVMAKDQSINQLIFILELHKQTHEVNYLCKDYIIVSSIQSQAMEQSRIGCNLKNPTKHLGPYISTLNHYTHPPTYHRRGQIDKQLGQKCREMGRQRVDTWIVRHEY